MLSNSWSWFIIVLVVLNIAAMVWLLFSTSKSNEVDDDDTTGHTWDGIAELNNPLPRWWLWLFILTIIFSVVYLYLYPGMGNYAGSKGWTQIGAYEEARAENRAKQDAFFAEFADLDIPALANNEKAMATAERLFLNNCATCHGSEARGAKGFPNLTDDDWLYGAEPAQIQQSITNGRAGIMPNLGLKQADVTIMAHYVKHLAGGEASEYAIEKGKTLFATCAACHGADGTGNQALGAPNLTDDIWLHGSGIGDLERILANGIQGNMPSFRDLLSPAEIELLSAYVISVNK